MIALWFVELHVVSQAEYYSILSPSEPSAWPKVLLLSSYSRYWQKGDSMGMRFVSLMNFVSSSLIPDRPLGLDLRVTGHG